MKDIRDDSVAEGKSGYIIMAPFYIILNLGNTSYYISYCTKHNSTAYTTNELEFVRLSQGQDDCNSGTLYYI